MTEYAGFNDDEPELTEAEIKKAKRKKLGMNILKGAGYVALGSAALIGVAFSGNSRSMGRPGVGWNAPQQPQQPMRSNAPTQGVQWQPWMSQGQLNTSNGQMYYPINYGNGRYTG